MSYNDLYSVYVIGRGIVLKKEVGDIWNQNWTKVFEHNVSEQMFFNPVLRWNCMFVCIPEKVGDTFLMCYLDTWGKVPPVSLLHYTLVIGVMSKRIQSKLLWCSRTFHLITGHIWTVSHCTALKGIVFWSYRCGDFQYVKLLCMKQCIACFASVLALRIQCCMYVMRLLVDLNINSTGHELRLFVVIPGV